MSKKSYIVMGLVAFLFAFIVMKEVSLPKFVLIFGALVGGGFLFVKGMGKPEIISYLLVAYLPFSKVLAGDFGGFAQAFNLTNLLIGFVVMVWISGRYVQDEPMWIRSPLNFPIFLFMMAGLLSVIRGSHYGFGGIQVGAVLAEFKRWITPLFVYYLFLNTVKTREMIRNVVIIMVIVTTLVGMMAAWDYATLGNVSSLEKARIGGIATHSNSLAAFFNYYMFLPFGFFLMNMNRFKFWGLLLPFMIQFRGIMVTFSRGGYLAFGFGLMAIMFFKNKMTLLAMIFGLGLVIAFPQVLPSGIRYRMSQTLNKDVSYVDSFEAVEGSLDASSANRIEIWKGALRMIKDHPLFGVGYGLFYYTIPSYYPGGSIDAHNTYLIIGAEMGVPTLILFLIILAIVFWHTHKLYNTTKDPFAKALALGFLGGLYALLMSNMFGSRLNSQEISSYFWILSAIVMRLLILDARGDYTGSSLAAQPVKQKSYKLDACWSEEEEENKDE